MRLVGTILLTCLIQFLSAQETKLITNFRHLEVKNGLPENDVKAFLADDQNGYWFRTTNYVVYYNGHDFISYGKKGLFALSSTAIQTFNIQQDHLYVFGKEGVDRIHIVSKRVEPIFKPAKGKSIKAGYYTQKGQMILVLENGEIVQVENGKVRKIDSLKMYSFSSIHETKQGKLLVSNNNNELVVLSPSFKTLKHIHLPITILLNGEFHVGPDNKTIVGAFRKLFYYDPILDTLKWYKAPVPKGRLFLPAGKYLYSVSGFHALSHYNEETKKTASLEFSLTSNYSINSIGADKNKALVLCTNQGIILYQVPYAFISYPEQLSKEISTETTRRAIVELPDHRILFVTYGENKIYDPVKGTYTSLSIDKNNGYAALIDGTNFWLGSDGTGLYKFNWTDKNGRARPTYNIKEKGALHVTSILKYSDDELLIGKMASANSLLLFNTRTSTYTPFVLQGWKRNVLSEKVSHILRSASLIYLCTNEGFFRLQNGNRVTLHLGKKELGTDIIHYAYPLGGQIWLATDIGLILYDIQKQKIVKRINEEDGLAGNFCLSILPDRFSTIWVPTYTGLSRIHLQKGKIWNYYMQDGMKDNEYNFASYLKAEDGTIYLGGLNGFVQIKPTPPDDEVRTRSLHLDQVILYKKQQEKLVDIEEIKELSMHEKDDRLNLVFSVNDHLSPEYVRYAYKIDGLHNTWISLEQQNKINLEYLPSGTYTLRLSAKALDNRKTTHFYSMPLRVFHYWYESKWFYFLLSLIFIASILGFLYYRYAVDREIEKIRTDLANDIHDEIGTQLTRSLMRLELLKNKPTLDIEGIAKVEKQLRNTIQSFRNVLWSLNMDNIKTDDLVGRLNTLLEEMFEGTRFGFLVTNLSADVIFQKSIQVKRNLLLIIKELANNTIKHSNGDFFEIVIRYHEGHWNILIADNGQNPNAFIQEGNGQGMTSLKKRMEKKQNGFFVSLYL